MTTNRVLLVAVGLLAMACLASARQGSKRHIPPPTCERPAGDKQQKVLDNVHPQIEEKTGKSFAFLVAISFRERYSGSEDYHMKVKATEKDGSVSFFHIKISAGRYGGDKIDDYLVCVDEKAPILIRQPCRER